MKADTNCIYCNLPLYGSGCRYGPRSIHVHPTPDKCIYCGLKIVGRGCRYSPDGVHVRFSSFGRIQSESISLNGYVIKEIQKPITSHKAYTLGLIDEDGHILRQPETESEKESLCLSEQILINFKKNHLKDFLFTLSESLLTNTIKENAAFDSVKFEKELEFKESIEQIANKLYNIIEQYKEHLSIDEINQYVIESFISANNEK